MEQMKIIYSNLEYDNLLLSLIPQVSKMKYKSGSEGVAYFVDENFVIKEISFCFENDESDKYINSFNLFCQEIKGFFDKGFAVPQIYSWVGLKDCDNSVNFYILQERVKGEHLFEIYLEDIFYHCSNFCGIDEFNEALKNRSGSLYQKIVETHLKHFIETDEKLLSMSDVELERYILSHYGMIKTRQYSWVDVHSGNVLFDGNKLTIIDNSFALNNPNIQYRNAKSLVLTDTIDIFLDHAEFLDFVNEDYLKQFDSFGSLIIQNKNIAAEALKRFINKINYVVEPVIKSKAEYVVMRYELKKLFGTQKTEELLSEVQKEF